LSQPVYVFSSQRLLLLLLLLLLLSGHPEHGT
jgi:hypothetical protein